MKNLLLCCLALALSLPAFPARAGTVTSTIPLDSWVYPALDRLAGLGLVDSSLAGTRPWTRLEAARQTAEALDGARLGDPPPAARRLLQRLERELREQLAEVRPTGELVAESYFKPSREVSLSYHYREGGDSFIAGTNARQFALSYNNDGIDYEEGHRGQLLIAPEARLGGVFLLEARPLLSLAEGEGAELELLQGAARLALGPVELSAGRQSLWWGQGRHGALVLTNNAKPLDMVRVNNPSPVLLPWIFRYLGPFRFDLFISRLEDDRVVPEPYFGGLRLDFKPLPWLELGASRTAMFGGEGRPDVDFGDFLTILGGENLSGEEDTSNSVAALDLRLRLPFLPWAELYGEIGGEDEADNFIANTAYLCGIYLPRLDADGRLALRVEYADLTRIDNNSPPWYRHGIYRSGYTYEKRIMGHHVGGAAEDLYAELEMLLPADVTAKLSYNYESRGADQASEERHRQPALAVEWLASPRLALKAAYAYDQIDNADFVDGREREAHLAEMTLQGNW